MSDTLEISLKSVLDQLDERYEVLVLDDGSSDSSLSVLDKISKIYHNFRYIPLIRDSRRKLGETRNLSIEAARGKYVILHIDADDKWGNHIDSFIRLFHDLSKRLDLDNFMLSGKQIHIASREFMLENKYPNVYYTEDRILWTQLASKGALLCINHKIFRKRIPIKKRKKKIVKVIESQYSSMIVSFSYHPNPTKSLFEYLRKIFTKSDWSFLLSFLNFFLLLPSFIYGVIFNRAKRIDCMKNNYREFLTLDLNQIEKEYLDEFGKFNLSLEERKIYLMN
tara:strand:- start:246 stop:1085 length:840 start_codon:yes stop_codon:yes gene_type:complete